MKTNQIMKRDFFDAIITQRTKDSYFNATDLLKYFNKSNNKSKRFKDFWDNANTKEFLTELACDLNRDNSAHLNIVVESDLYTTGRGRNGATYMHPYLFVKFAMWLSPEFEVKVIKWVYDNLIDFRNQAGDHYKIMCDSIRDTYKTYFQKDANPLVYKNEARFLNTLVKGIHISNNRNKLTENELDLLNRLQLLNINLIRKFTPKEERYKKLRDFSELYLITEK